MRTTARQINIRYLDESYRAVDKAAGRETPVDVDYNRWNQDKAQGLGSRQGTSRRQGRSLETCRKIQIVE